MTKICIDLNLLNDLISKAKYKGADAADVLLMSSTSLSVVWRMGSLEHLERAEDTNIGLRVLIGHRQALVSSSEFTPTSTEQLVELAVTMARTVPKDPFCGLADPELLARELPDLDIYDPTEPSVEKLMAMVCAAEETGRAVPGITNSQGASANWSRHIIALMGSNGLATSYATSHISLSAALLAGDSDNGLERDYEYTSAVYLTDLPPPEEVGRIAATRALQRVGARKVKTQTVPVIYASREASGLLSHFLSAINGVSVVRGTTFLKESLHRPVFATNVIVVDDPLRQRGLRSKPCDAEGLPTQRRVLVENGILQSWILDLRSARKLGLKTTAHASRTSSGLPSPAPTNTYLVPGVLDPVVLIANIQQGLYITELFGMGVNGVTGDYSCGATGFWIEKGQLSYPVHEITVAGNLKDMFRSLTVANDLEFRYGIDSPTVQVESMIVAGH